MPTPDQMHRVWESEFEFFKGKDPMDYHSTKGSNEQFTGKVIGTIEFDPKNRDLKIVVNKEIEPDLPTNP